MKILFVSGIYPPDIGGPATYVSRMAAELAGRGHSVQVLAPGEKEETLHDPFLVRRVRRGRGIPGRNIRMLQAALAMARGSDLIYATGSPWDSWLISLLTARMLRKKWVIKVVGDSVWERAQRMGTSDLLMDEFNKKRGRLDIELLKIFRNALACRADCIITPSNFLKDVVQEWGLPAHKIHVIYNAVEQSPFAERSQKNGMGPMVTTARLVPWKGIDGVIRALHSLPEEIKLIVIGDGPLMNSLQDLAKKEQLQGRVLFTGSIPKEEVFKWLDLASVFVLNSRYEGFPHVVLEAMSAGVPVVATAAGGNREVIQDGENGLLTPVGDEKELAENILHLLRDEGLRERFSRKALQGLAAYSWPVLTAGTEKIFMNILQ